MEESLDTKHRSNLLCYDRAFSENILDYANTCFRRYVKKKPSQQVQQLLADWKGITRVYSEAMDEVYDRSSLHLIHGDLNFSNIHIHKQKVGRLKIVDWEWAGIGGWWFDLVALLKMVAPDLEQEGFDVFLKASNRQNRCFEQRIYQWAKLQRGLFDASFFAKECVDSALVTRRKINIEHHMLRALDRAQLALQELQKKGLTACRLNP
jgi:5-methylthioribose kinase